MAKKTRRSKRRTRKPSRRRIIVEKLYKAGQFFAITFMVLLIIAAIALAKGDERDANQAAEYAYYSLVLSVVLLLVATALEESKEESPGSTRRRTVAKAKEAEA